MGSQNQYWMVEDCPNCGEKDEMWAWKGARMGATSWGHSYSCCSDACGKRLAQRLNSGMITREQIGHVPRSRGYHNSNKERRLRLRIKQLEHQLATVTDRQSPP